MEICTVHHLNQYQEFIRLMVTSLLFNNSPSLITLIAPIFNNNPSSKIALLLIIIIIVIRGKLANESLYLSMRLNSIRNVHSTRLHCTMYSVHHTINSNCYRANGIILRCIYGIRCIYIMYIS